MERGFEGVAGGEEVMETRRHMPRTAPTWSPCIHVCIRACLHIRGVDTVSRLHVRLLHPFRVAHTWATRAPLSSASRCYKRNSRFASWTDVVYIDVDLGERKGVIAILLRVDDELSKDRIGIFILWFNIVSYLDLCGYFTENLNEEFYLYL